MKTIKHILTRYTAFLWALLKPLGAWGVLAVAALDGGFIGLPMDAVVAGYVYQDRARFLLYVFMAATGSALGSIVIYVIGYTGGEEFLRKRMSAERFEKLHSAFNHHPFWALMFPAMLPPPTPFKLFVLAAAISEMSFVRFLLAVFCGRTVRFLILAILTIQFGPDVVRLSGQLFARHYYWIAAAGMMGLLVWLTLRGKKRRRRREAAAE
ncbi:MAG TPA: VTT domain-containing protein [Terriglobales bacterium]|nr:VTT domain-containing protein [Terriglobales bacterium]